MANQPESATYDAGVYQVETTDAVQGGVGGIDNKALLNLANRTAYLKSHIDALEAGTFIPPTVAPLASPTFTGTVSGPTATSGDSSTKFATTAFVQNACGGIAAVSGLTNANVTLTAAQYGCGIITLAGTLTGNINIIFPTQGDEWVVMNNTTGAFTVTCKTAAGSGIAVTQGKAAALSCDATNIVRSDNDLNNAALTGNPTAPTQTGTDNSTKIATTAFVTAAIAALSSASLGSSGYTKFPGGLILQWQTFSFGSLSQTTNTLSGSEWDSAHLTWPITFPTGAIGAIAAPTVSSNGQFLFAATQALTTTDGYIFLTCTPSTSFPITGKLFVFGY